MSKAPRINGQFAPRPVAMLKSPAMRVLSLTGRRILDRIEIELAQHRGRDNGRLPVTHQDFRDYGITGELVGAGIREAIALGFVEITEHGRGGNAKYRKPNLFRLTYLSANGAAPTDEWRHLDSVEYATKLAAQARSNVATDFRRKPGKTNSRFGKPLPGRFGKPLPATGSENPH